MKKILALSVILFGLYNLVLSQIAPVVGPIIPSNSFQANIIKAQKFVYDTKDCKIVIVGSSLANELVQRYLPVKCFNLSLIGFSLYDGLEIVKQSGIKPEIIVIETNLMDKKRDAHFTDMLFLPGLYTLRKYLPALREENQPVNIMRAILTKLFYFFRGFPKSQYGDLSNQQSNEIPDIHSDLDEKQIVISQGLIASRIEEYNIIPTQESINGITRDIKAYIKYFEQNNVLIVFFEMPEDNILYNSNRLITFRNIISTHFFTGRYVYLPSPDWKNFTTTDGTHLDRKSAEKYTIYFNNIIKQFMQ